MSNLRFEYYAFLCVIFLCAHLFCPLEAVCAQFLDRQAHQYVLDKLNTHDIVFLGTTHKQPRILELVGRLLPYLHGHGVTHLALEIGGDQQPQIDRYLQSGQGLTDIELHRAIDCPQYRSLFTTLRKLEKKRRPEAVAVDLAVSEWSGGIGRDAHMARTLVEIVDRTPDAKILVVLGSLHVLRKLEWQGKIAPGHEAIRTKLEQLRPGLKMHSIINIVSSIEEECDFSRAFGLRPGAVALDLDSRFSGWRMGLTRCLAIKPAPVHELVDGVIIY